MQRRNVKGAELDVSVDLVLLSHTVYLNSMPNPNDLSRFYCPLCGSNHYQLVGVKSPRDGKFRIVDGFYQCAGCTVMFGDAEAFMQLVRDTIVDAPHYRERRPTREYPPDAATLITRRGGGDADEQ